MECAYCKKDFHFFLIAMLIVTILTGAIGLLFPDPLFFFIFASICFLGTLLAYFLARNEYKKCDGHSHQTKV